MKRAWALALVAGFLISCAGGGSKGKTEGALPAAYALDAAGSQLSAAVLKNESKTVTVRFPKLSGGLDLEPRPRAELSVDIAALDTGDAARDANVRDLFFEATQAAFKDAVFTLGSVEGDLSKLAVGQALPLKAEGKLSLHGATFSLSGPLTLSRSEAGYSVSFKENWTVNIKEAGMLERLKVLNEKCPQPHRVGLDVKLTGLLLFKKA